MLAKRGFHTTLGMTPMFLLLPLPCYVLYLQFTTASSGQLVALVAGESRGRSSCCKTRRLLLGPRLIHAAATALLAWPPHLIALSFLVYYICWSLNHWLLNLGNQHENQEATMVLTISGDGIPAFFIVFQYWLMVRLHHALRRNKLVDGVRWCVRRRRVV